MDHRETDQGRHAWSVAIFSSREAPDALLTTVERAVEACRAEDAIVDVMVNGNLELAEALSGLLTPARIEGLSTIQVRVWHIPVPDKSNAWNRYLGDIWPRSELAFFVDGYAHLQPGALHALRDAIDGAPDALGATGVPTTGRSATRLREQMLRHGGIHGNLFALRGAAMQQLRDVEFRVPFGMYRIDGLLGAVICFGLDPASNSWDPSRMAVHPQATWTTASSPSPWRLATVTGHVKRRIRQSQGLLENRAVREHLAVRKERPEHLPRMVRDLVQGWIAASPWRAAKVFLRHPASLYTAMKLRYAPERSEATLPPQLIGSFGPSRREGLQDRSP